MAEEMVGVHGRVKKTTKDYLTQLYGKLMAIEGFEEKYKKKTGKNLSKQSVIEDCIEAGRKVLEKKYK